MSEAAAEPVLSSAERITQAFNDNAEPVVESAPVVEQTTNSGHPAWQSILDKVPEMLRDSIRPELEQWDKGVEAKLASVHEQYSGYKNFLDQQITPEQLETANRLYHALDTDPKGFYEQLREHYNFGVSTVEEPEIDLGEYATGEVDLSKNPLFKQQAEQLAEMQQLFEAQQEQQAGKEAEIWLQTKQAQITAQLEEKKIEVDWDYILPRAAAEAERTGDNDKALDNAAKAFEAMVVKYRTPVANTMAPPVMTPNGAVPSTQFNSTALAPEDRRKLLTQMLAQAFKD